MALDKQRLTAAITAAMEKQFPKDGNNKLPDAARVFAADLAAAVDAFVRSGEVKGVQVTGHDLTLSQSGSVTVQ
jgi:hypothetical protein